MVAAFSALQNSLHCKAKTLQDTQQREPEHPT